MDISDFEAYAALKGDETLRVRPDRTALLVVDMQRYFVEPEFPFGQVLAKFQPDAAAAYFDRVKTTVVPNVQELLKPILEQFGRGTRPKAVVPQQSDRRRRRSVVPQSAPRDSPVKQANNIASAPVHA